MIPELITVLLPSPYTHSHIPVRVELKYKVLAYTEGYLWSSNTLACGGDKCHSANPD